MPPVATAWLSGLTGGTVPGQGIPGPEEKTDAWFSGGYIPHGRRNLSTQARYIDGFLRRLLYINSPKLHELTKRKKSWHERGLHDAGPLHTCLGFDVQRSLSAKRLGGRKRNVNDVHQRVPNPMNIRTLLVCASQCLLWEFLREPGFRVRSLGCGVWCAEGRLPRLALSDGTSWKSCSGELYWKAPELRERHLQRTLPEPRLKLGHRNCMPKQRSMWIDLDLLGLARPHSPCLKLHHSPSRRLARASLDHESRVVDVSAALDCCSSGRDQ